MIKIIADYHTHTRYSHGRGRVEDNVRAARSKGLEAVAITDHGPANLFGVGVSRPDTFLTIKEDAVRCREKIPGIEILVGVEANITGLDGALDVPEKILSQLDLVLAGLHRIVRPATAGDAISLGAVNMINQYTHGMARRTRTSNTKAMVEAVHRHRINIITHPGLHMPIDTWELAKNCAQRGTALEINTGHHFTTVDFVKVAARAGVKFSIDSDAHTPDRVGDLAWGVHLAEQAGLEPEQVINALQPAEVTV